MLHIENTSTSTYFANGSCRKFGTLDDIPDFALSSLAQLYNYLLRPFQKSYGIIIHGPINEGDDDWGRRIHIQSGETIQIKFAPICILQDFYDGVALISLKLKGAHGSNVRTCILFSPEAEVPPPMPLVNRMCDPLGPRGMHILNVSMFREHDPHKQRKPNGDSSTVDSCGYESVRSTTFSITKSEWKKSRRQDFVSFEHSNAWFVAPGTSVFVVAAECVGCKIQDTQHRPAEPVNPRQFEKMSEIALGEICKGDHEVGKSAIAASISICEMLSGDGLISMLSDPFFKTSLPSKLKSPLGTGLIICMAVRIAMTAGLHGQKAGPVNNQIACAELRTIFESQIPAIPYKDPRWAIDIAISFAKKQAHEKASGVCNQTFEVQLEDQLVYWHRVGQGIISALFGIWSSYDFTIPNGFGQPWRFHDPLIGARDLKTIELTPNVNSIRDHPRIIFASIAQRRTTLIKLLLNTERYLRTGEYDGVCLMPANDTPKDLAKIEKNTLEDILGGDASESPTDEQLQKIIYETQNLKAMRQAQIDMSEALVAGPVAQYKHDVGCYLVSERQESQCCDCQEPVHVLQGIVMCFAFGECPNCHAKRCLNCSAKFNLSNMLCPHQEAKEGRNDGSVAPIYGSTCKKCGTTPLVTSVQKTRP